jgi:PKD repeat protein
LNTWQDKVVIETSRNGESASWIFYPTFAKMKLNSIGGTDGKYWILYEGTPGGKVTANDSLYLSNNNKYSANADNPFGENDIKNTSEKAAGSEWAYITDSNLDRSIFLAITDDEVRDNYYQLEDNMTVLGFGRNKGAPPLQYRDDVNAVLVLGLVESKSPTKVKNAIDIAWENSKNQLPIPSFQYTVDTNNQLLVDFDATASVDPDGQIVSYDWEFGDESTSNGIIVSHTYSAEGRYDVKLLVTDDEGDTASIVSTIQVSDLAFLSDDFNDEDLNTNIWEFINPALDGTYEILDEETSFVLGLTVPAGARHEIWEDIHSTPVGILHRRLQHADFDIEAKFESAVFQR